MSSDDEAWAEDWTVMLKLHMEEMRKIEEMRDELTPLKDELARLKDEVKRKREKISRLNQLAAKDKRKTERYRQETERIRLDSTKKNRQFEKRKARSDRALTAIRFPHKQTEDPEDHLVDTRRKLLMTSERDHVMEVLLGAIWEKSDQVWMQVFDPRR